MRHHWSGILATLDPPRTIWLVPYRYGDEGWFDYEPVPPSYPIGIWALSMSASDEETITDVRSRSKSDWTRIIATRTKEDAGHEAPWFTFLRGGNPQYPETIFAQACEVAAWRVAQIRGDEADLTEVNIHHWQEHNPVTTEALVQLTLGGPQPAYNGGLLHCRLRYFDPVERRPGLPSETAALITQLEAHRTTLHLVNLALTPRSLIIQAGGFAEHRFQKIRSTQLTSDYPGASQEVSLLADVITTWEEAACDGVYLRIELPPTSQIILDVTMDLHVAAPTYAPPWAVERED